MKNSTTRLGFFARADNGGLGAESWEFARHLQPDKVLVIRGEHGHYPERFQGLNCQYVDGVPSHADIDKFIRDIDILFSIETFYNWGAVEMARSRGIKTVLRVNYEMNLNNTDPNLPVADYFIAPSTWNIDKYPFQDRTKYIPFPVNREVLPFERKEKIKTFYHIAGHQLFEDRNGTQVLLDALPHIHKDVQVKILTQHPLVIESHDNIEVCHTDFENYYDVHQGDCLILPRRFGGQSLNLNEALSKGNPVIMPNISPNEYLHPDELIPTESSYQVTTQGGAIDVYQISPIVLANKINQLALTDVGYLSDLSNKLADGISWGKLEQEYIKYFEGING